MAITLHDYRFIFHKNGNQSVVFEIENIDKTDATYKYYGYVAESGAWLIQRLEVVSSTVSLYSYVSGKTYSDYEALWTAGVYVGTETFASFSEVSTL